MEAKTIVPDAANEINCLSYKGPRILGLLPRQAPPPTVATIASGEYSKLSTMSPTYTRKPTIYILSGGRRSVLASSAALSQEWEKGGLNHVIQTHL